MESTGVLFHNGPLPKPRGPMGTAGATCHESLFP